MLTLSPNFLSGLGQFIREVDLRFSNLRKIPDNAFVFENSYCIKSVNFLEGNFLNESLRPSLFFGLSGAEAINSDLQGVLNLSSIGKGIEVYPNFMIHLSNSNFDYLDIRKNLIRKLHPFSLNKSSIIYLDFWNGNCIDSLFSGTFFSLANVLRIDSQQDGKMDLSQNSCSDKDYSLKISSNFL
jgi:hypothetical protein